MNLYDNASLRGELLIEAIDSNGQITKLVDDKNLIVLSGRNKVAQSLIASSTTFITGVVFGTGGASPSDPTNPLAPDPNATELTQAISASVGTDYTFTPNIPSSSSTPKVIFSIVVPKITALNNMSLNEMALMMNNGNAFSIKTFATITKSDSISLNITWTIYV